MGSYDPNWILIIYLFCKTNVHKIIIFNKVRDHFLLFLLELEMNQCDGSPFRANPLRMKVGNEYGTYWWGVVREEEGGQGQAKDLKGNNHMKSRGRMGLELIHEEEGCL